MKEAVQNAALSLADAGSLAIYPPVWTVKGSPTTPKRGDPNSGSNARGDYVSVFVDLTYAPIIKQVFNTPILPSITISAESTLVVNN